MSTRYTLVVGTKDWSSWSLRAYVALRATGAQFEEVFVPLRQQPLTGRGQHHAAGSALEQDQVKLVLQRLDLRADSRLADVQRLRGTGQVTGLGDGDKAA